MVVVCSDERMVSEGTGREAKERGLCERHRERWEDQKKKERESKSVDVLIDADAFECQSGRASYLSVSGINHYEV